eukprot:GHVT01025898.1.p1 GENE.GHVT01025898.1~~GHVT01025898.1.p1  ORF type:complete len:297 (-),score=45.02 GHVT01025898.1:1526-2416(-)
MSEAALKKQVPSGPPSSGGEDGRNASVSVGDDSGRSKHVLDLKAQLDLLAPSPSRLGVSPENTEEAFGGGSAAKRFEADSPENAKALCTVLEQLAAASVNRHILSRTKVGVSVGQLRRHSSEPVRLASSELVEKWKNVIGSRPSISAGSTATAAGVKAKSDVDHPAGDGNSDTPQAAAPRGKVETPSAGKSNQPAERSLTFAPKRFTPLEEANEAPLKKLKSVEIPADFPGPFCGNPARDKARAFLWRALVEGTAEDHLKAMDIPETGTKFASQHNRQPTPGRLFYVCPHVPLVQS